MEFKHSELIELAISHYYNHGWTKGEGYWIDQMLAALHKRHANPIVVVDQGINKSGDKYFDNSFEGGMRCALHLGGAYKEWTFLYVNLDSIDDGMMEMTLYWLLDPEDDATESSIAKEILSLAKNEG